MGLALTLKRVNPLFLRRLQGFGSVFGRLRQLQPLTTGSASTGPVFFWWEITTTLAIFSPVVQFCKRDV